MPDFKNGDRVRFTGKHPCGLFRRDSRIGRLGTVTNAADPNNIRVRWDDREQDSGHYRENLELVAVALDLTKPLRLTVEGMADEGPCTILAELKDGGFIIDGPRHGRTASWVIFDRYGKFVSSGDRTGFGLTVVQGPVVHVIGDTLASCGEGVNVTIVDGVVTKVELVK